MTGLHFLLVFVIIALINDNEAAAPFFLQAITSALGTIPFSAGPMTTGLVGAKLAVGSKLLYYLGFFGRRRSKPKSTPKRVSPPKPNMAGMPGGFQGGFPGGMPGGFQGGFPGGMPGGFQGGFPGGMPGGFQGGFPGGMPGGFQGGMPGGFPQQFGGFGQQGFSNQNPFGGMDPSQVYQMLAAQGIDPAMAMQVMNMEGMGGGQAIPASQFPFPAGAGGVPGSAAGAGMGAASGAGHGKLPNQNQVNTPEDSQGGGGEDIESFFTFLRDMDENSCISRLMCDIGADPSFLGDFSENIHGIISSLNVMPSSGAFQYIQIMETGRREGNCGPKFPQCGDAAYEVVKNVAPSVGVPENINIDAINKLQ